MNKLGRFLFPYLLFMAGCLVIVFREPALLAEPRLWAEEGTRYFSYAFYFSGTSQWYQGLINVQRGYFALWPNVASTLAANLVTVEDAPLFTTLAALLVQLIPLGLVIWGKSSYWSSPARKTVAILACIITPLCWEIWLNTINSQFYLALAAVLILTEPTLIGLRRKWIYRLLLGVAGLTGLVASILAPLYALLAWMDRDKERAVQAAILGVCAAIQVGLLINFSASDKTITERLMDGRLHLLVFSMWTQGVGMLVGGMDWMAQLASWILAKYESGDPHLIAAWVGLLIAAVLLFGWLLMRLSTRERLIFLGSYGLILVFSSIGSLVANKLSLVVPGNAARYFWVPNVVFILLLMVNGFNRSFGKLRRYLCLFLLIVSLAQGAISYRDFSVMNATGPRWRAEVALWRADPNYKIKIWPPGWEIHLQK